MSSVKAAYKGGRKNVSLDSFLESRTDCSILDVEEFINSINKENKKAYFIKSNLSIKRVSYTSDFKVMTVHIKVGRG